MEFDNLRVGFYTTKIESLNFIFLPFVPFDTKKPKFYHFSDRICKNSCGIARYLKPKTPEGEGGGGHVIVLWSAAL